MKKQNKKNQNRINSYVKMKRLKIRDTKIVTVRYTVFERNEEMSSILQSLKKKPVFLSSLSLLKQFVNLY